MRFETLAVHAGGEIDAATGALVPPIHLATTFRHGPAGERLTGHEYQREAHPTGDRLELAMAAVEGGATALAFSSGMAAITALLASLPRGGEVLLPSDGYGGVRALATEILAEDGIGARIVDPTDPAAVEAAIGPRTSAILLETPSNPLLDVTDLGAIVRLAHARGVRVFCDNTFATPALQRPLEHGVDVVVHSATKYIAGHHDALAGALVFREADAFAEKVARRRLVTGPILAPMSAYLVLRGLRTLSVRMRQHSENAAAIAGFLAEHPEVARVRYPGLPSHPGHEVAARQMRAPGGMLSFQLRGGESAAIATAAALRLIVNATSLGGVETSIEHRASIERPTPTTPADLLRLSVGLEHPEDLIDDLRQALASLR